MMLLFLAAVVTIPLGLDLYLPVPEDNPLTLENVEENSAVITIMPGVRNDR